MEDYNVVKNDFYEISELDDPKWNRNNCYFNLLMEKEIPDKNLFMMCKKLNTCALAELPNGYHVRTCRRNELDIWKKMPFDDEKTAEQYSGYSLK